MFNCFNTSLKGFKCKEVSTQNKVVISDLTFKYRIVGDASYTEDLWLDEDDEDDEYDFPESNDYEHYYEDDDLAPYEYSAGGELP